MEKTLLILAAGMGSRYGGMKQLDTVGPAGETIMEYSLFDALQAGFEKAVFVIRRDMEEAFQICFGETWKSRISIEYVFQELGKIPLDYAPPAGRKKPWGTGHALLSAGDTIREPFVTLNADDYYGPGAFRLAAEVLETMNGSLFQAALVGYRLKNTLSANGGVSRGICRINDKNSLLTISENLGIRRKRDGRIYDKSGKILEENSIVSMNLWAFCPSVFTVAESCFSVFLEQKGSLPDAEFYIPDVIAFLLRSSFRRIPVYETNETWYGLTYRQDLSKIRKALKRAVREGIYPADLRIGP